MADPMIAANILAAADAIVDGNRRNDYGTPLENHQRTAQFWSAYLGKVLLPEDVCMLNILQKISRGMNSITHDTLVDIAGYARNIQIIKQERAGKNAPAGYQRAGLSKPLPVQEPQISGASKAWYELSRWGAPELSTSDNQPPKSFVSDSDNGKSDSGPVSLERCGCDCEKVR